MKAATIGCISAVLVLIVFRVYKQRIINEKQVRYQEIINNIALNPPENIEYNISDLRLCSMAYVLDIWNIFEILPEQKGNDYEMQYKIFEQLLDLLDSITMLASYSRQHLSEVEAKENIAKIADIIFESLQNNPMLLQKISHKKDNFLERVIPLLANSISFKQQGAFLSWVNKNYFYAKSPIDDFKVLKKMYKYPYELRSVKDPFDLEAYFEYQSAIASISPILALFKVLGTNDEYEKNKKINELKSYALNRLDTIIEFQIAQDPTLNSFIKHKEGLGKILCARIPTIKKMEFYPSFNTWIQEKQQRKSWLECWDGNSTDAN